MPKKDITKLINESAVFSLKLDNNIFSDKQIDQRKVKYILWKRKIKIIKSQDGGYGTIFIN